MTTVLLFDIDGTLVLTGGAGQRAMSRAFEELFSIADGFQGIPMAGRTDTWILARAAARHAIPAAALQGFRDVYLGHLERELRVDHPRKAVMPGIRDLLDTLSARRDVYLALLTGNYREAARLKLEHFDLWRYFPCGAFADDAEDRNSLVPKALARVRECGGPSGSAAQVIVVGDTPHDVECAAAAGARAVGVATGPFTQEQLRASGAAVTFEDLRDTGAFVRLVEETGPARGAGPADSGGLVSLR